MFQRIHKSLGGAGLALAVVALIAAIGGTAYAATKLNGTQKKEVEKIAKKSAGKPGAPGATGPQGQPGAAGKEGAKGQNGLPGAAGKSVTVNPVQGTECEALNGAVNGAVVEEEGSGNPTYVCEGPKGQAGSPWTFDNVLPPGATETGTWVYNANVQKLTVEVEGVKEEVTVGDIGPGRVPISFAIPLEAGLSAVHVHFGNQEEAAFNTICTGTGFIPKANPGELCVYLTTASLAGTEFLAAYKQNPGFQLGASQVGSVLEFKAPTENAKAAGSFAVTGCKAETAFPCP